MADASRSAVHRPLAWHSQEDAKPAGDEVADVHLLGLLLDERRLWKRVAHLNHLRRVAASTSAERAGVRNTTQAARCDRRARAGGRTESGDCLDLSHLPSLASAASRGAWQSASRARNSPLESKEPGRYSRAASASPRRGVQGARAVQPAQRSRPASCTAAACRRGVTACAPVKSGGSAKCTPWSDGLARCSAAHGTGAAISVQRYSAERRVCCVSSRPRGSCWPEAAVLVCRWGPLVRRSYRDDGTTLVRQTRPLLSR